MSDHHLAKGLSVSSIHDSIHSFPIPKTPLVLNIPFQAQITLLQNCFPFLGSLPFPLTVYPYFDSCYSHSMPYRMTPSVETSTAIADKKSDPTRPDPRPDPPWLAESVLKKTCEKCQQILSRIKFYAVTWYKRTECERSLLVAAEGRCGSQCRQYAMQHLHTCTQD